MARVLLYSAMVVLAGGCAFDWPPSKTEPFCIPKGKFSRDTKHVVIGIRCGW